MRSSSAARGALAAALLFALVPCTSLAQAKAKKRPEPARAAAARTMPDTTALAALHYRYIGPEGNRTDAVAGVPGDPNIYYAGAASGGLWKTTDAGAHWDPIFDSQPVASIGAVAVAPSDPNVVWVGTGESFIRSHISIGWGMYRSTDAGKSWTHIGLENTGRIARIAIDPTNPDRALVAALGHAYGPQPDRGIFRTTDGGKTWDKVLFVNDSTGGVDVLLDPIESANRVRGDAGRSRSTRGDARAAGRGAASRKSTDGGTTWTRLVGHGLPTRAFGKVGLGISPAMPQRVYARDRDGRRHPARWRAERHGAPVPLGRCGQVVAAHQQRSAAGGAHRVLRSHGRGAGQRERGVLSGVQLHEDARRRQDDDRCTARAGAARRSSRHSGSIRRTATASSSRTTAASASRPRAAARGIAFSCRSRRCTT